jgi:hypothetical protein
MSDDAFELLEQAARSGGSAAAFDFLARQFRELKQFPQLFETRLMKKRRELGMPLIQTEPIGELPGDTRRQYEDAYIDAAREVGGLYLAGGDIVRAWPYFRAIGETAAVAAAIEKVEPGEGIEPIIEIAFHERANPRKGFELILANYGTCSAITTFEQYPGREGREDSVRLLVRKLHGDLVESLKHAIAVRDEKVPDSRHIPTLVAGRDWLFEENNYHIDTSHLAAVIRFSSDLTDRETLTLAVELTEYGRRLSPLFQYKGHPPFDNIYVDYGTYMRATLGEDADGAVAHFRQKVEAADPNEVGSGPAQVLVGLLARLGRYSEAVDASVKFLSDTDPSQLSCPTVVQLCEMAGDQTRMKELARQHGDLLSFAAAVLKSNS